MLFRCRRRANQPHQLLLLLLLLAAGPQLSGN